MIKKKGARYMVEENARMAETNLLKRLGGFALIGSPLLFLTSELLHPVTQADTAKELASVAINHNQWYLAHLLALGAIVLLPFAILTILNILDRRCLKLSCTGAVLSTIGIIAVSGLTSFDLVVWQMGINGASDEMVKLYDRITGSPGFSIPFLSIGPLALILGLLLLAVSLYRTKSIPRWQSFLLGAGILLYGLAGPVFPISNGHLVVILGAALMLASFGTLGFRLLLRL